MEQRQHRRQVAQWFAPTVLAAEWAAIIFTLWMSARSAAWWPIAVVILGRGQWTLMDNVGHWAAHYTLFRKKELNRLLEWLYFLPALTFFEEWRKEHFRHHAHLGTKLDPEWETFVRWKLLASDGAPGKPYAWCFARVPISDFKKNALQLRIWRDFKLFMFWASAVLMIAATHTWTLLALWLFAHFCVKPYFMFLSETSEHWKAPGQRTAPATYGSRTLRGLFFSLYKPYGDQWHAMHHDKPSIPPSQLRSTARAAHQAGYPSTTFTYFLTQIQSPT